MLTWILIILCSSLCASDPSYECGPHGKFEYCIDGIPGCVIGCHCHPGYYFDTDSKICEPNTKLSQDYRRHYNPITPTRVQNVEMPNTVTTELTTKDALDVKVDEIANDADDLGDWLYNQFFKTIENQVMNTTKPKDNQPILTRRSGMQIKKPVRRSHKHMHSKKSKKPKKKKNFKSKLLRITEDDSLFQSSSESSDDTSDDASSETESDTSEEDSDPRFPRKDKKKKDKDHGHKKIVIYNKKPIPQLPSFIFLPNMDSPFFPPIGLPPPAVPMYPMIPVPPVMGPMYPYPPPGMPPNGAQDSHNNVVTNGATIEAPTPPSVAPSEATVTTVTTEIPPITPLDSPAEEAPESESEPSAPLLRTRQRFATARSGFGRIPPSKRPKNKLFQKLRQKMMRQKKINNFFAERQMHPDFPINEENIPADILPSPDPMAENIKLPQQVDFKYLTELIHKMDPNGTTRANLVNALAEKSVPAPVVLPSRRNAYSLGPVINQAPNPYQNVIINNNTRRQNGNVDDSYYAHLGRQIATMIKNLDVTNNHDIAVEIEPNTEPPMLQPVFNEQRYSPPSYWERSVRSPIKYVGPYNESFSQEHLFNLENEVETAASTMRNLNLQELENIIFKMNTPKIPAKIPEEILDNHVHNIIIEPGRVTLILRNNSNTNSIYPAMNKIHTNISLRRSLNSSLYPDLSLVNRMYNFYPLTAKPQIIHNNNPYFIHPTRKSHTLPIIKNKFDQRIYSPAQSKNTPDQLGYITNQLRYNKNQQRYNTNQQIYNTNQMNYQPNQLKYNLQQPRYNIQQLNYNPEQLKYNLEQKKFNPEQTRRQNNEGILPIPTRSSKSANNNAFANTFTNNSNMTQILYNMKPPIYNIPSQNKYYYSTNNKIHRIEKPNLPIHLQSLTKKIHPIKSYSYFQHEFDDDF